MVAHSVAELVRVWQVKSLSGWSKSDDFGYARLASFTRWRRRLQDIADFAFQFVQSLRKIVNQLGNVGRAWVVRDSLDDG